MRKVYFVCMEARKPAGGVKQIYRHVDVLNHANIPARVVHRAKGFRCDWFENKTKIEYFSEIQLEPDSVIVFPANAGPLISAACPSIPRVIFSQGAYLPLIRHPLELSRTDAWPYLQPNTLGTLVVCKDAEDSARYAFPGTRVFRIINGIDTKKFHPAKGSQRKKQIAFMPRRNPQLALHLQHLLARKVAAEGWRWHPIEGVSEAEVARKLQVSSVFLSLVTVEGWSLPNAEAMACGCVVVGFDGRGGREYMRRGTCFRIPQGDVMGFARTLERIMGSPESKLQSVRAAAAKLIATEYSTVQETQSIVRAWSRLNALAERFPVTTQARARREWAGGWADYFWS